MNKPFVPPMMPWVPTGEPLGAPASQSFDPRIEVDDEALAKASQNAYPIVAKHKARSDRFGLMTGAAIALVLGGVTFASMHSGRSAKAVSSTTLAPARPADVPKTQPYLSSAVSGMQSFPATQSAALQRAPMAPPFVSPASIGAPPGSTARVDHGSVPIVVYDSSGRPGAAGGASILSTNDSATPALLSGATGAAVGGGGETNSARSVPMADPANTVVQGTLISAVLETSIQSDLPGFARAVVSQDVRSFDGTKILVPRSSRLIGEYKAGNSAGQKRVYLMWTRLVRPDGVSIALASPAVDSEGQAGIGGKVNSHFLQRFGSAILLSLLGSASAIGSGGATVVMGAGGQSAASVAAQHDSQRSATIHVMQGEPIRVFTARDLVFEPGSGKRG